MKSSRTTIGILVGLAFLLPLATSAQTATASTATSVGVQQIIALYTQLIQLLEQEITQLTATRVATPAPTISCPIYSTPACTGTLVPQGTDHNGCQLPPQCVANTNPPPATAIPAVSTAPAPTCTLTASPTSVTAGASVTLSWSATNAYAGSIAPSIAGFTLSSGSQTVTPTQTTDYVGSFTGTGGSAYCTALVTVVLAPTAETPANTNYSASTPSSTGSSCVHYNKTYSNGSTIGCNVKPGPGVICTLGLPFFGWTCNNGQWIESQ